MSRVGTNRWSIEILLGWEWSVDPECLSISKSDGIGSLQISGAVKDLGSVTAEDLLSMVDGPAAAADSVALSAGAFSGRSWSYDETDTRWRKWALGAGNLLLFVTYNCALAEAGIEDAEVNHMLSTLRDNGGAG